MTSKKCRFDTPSQLQALACRPSAFLTRNALRRVSTKRTPELLDHAAHVTSPNSQKHPELLMGKRHLVMVDAQPLR